MTEFLRDHLKENGPIPLLLFVLAIVLALIWGMEALGNWVAKRRAARGE